MELHEANDLLAPGYLPLESGHARLPSGMVVVAALNRVHRCSGEMLDWWFKRHKSQEEFVRWHPTEHVSAEYHDGMMFPVHVRAGQTLRGRIQTRPPGNLFDAAALAASGASVVTYGRGGPADGELWMMHTAHVGRDTDYGCEVRSRFWIGDFEPADAAPPPAVVAGLLSDTNACWQMAHCLEEFHYLSQFLPDLYDQEMGSSRR